VRGGLRWTAIVVGLAALVQSARTVSGHTTWSFVADGPQQLADVLRRSWPPDVGTLRDLAGPLLDTIHLATLGTLLAIGIAVPVALAAARNTTPHPVARAVAIVVIVASRSINSLIWALLLVAVVGPGLLAGVLALAFRSVGFVAKLLYEAIEESDPAPVEAIVAAGAGRPQVLTYAVAPQVAPAFAGIAAFRWDVNVREATVVGLVGAGGIGVPLDTAISALDWPAVAVILAVVLSLVLLAEAVSARIRRAVT
jgi:phosphonate transport system permease protein